VLAELCGVRLSGPASGRLRPPWLRRLDERYLLAVNPSWCPVDWPETWPLCYPCSPEQADKGPRLPPFTATIFDEKRSCVVQLIIPTDSLGNPAAAREHELLLRSVIDDARARALELESLACARELLSVEERWCRTGHCAERPCPGGWLPAHPNDAAALRWCPIGACDRYFVSVAAQYELARAALEQDGIVEKLSAAELLEGFALWTDAPERTHAEILGAFDAAIAKLRAELVTGEVSP
jgi:hypothetical protein